MGAFRFALYPPELAGHRPELKLAYLTGLDRVPWRTQVEVQDGLLICWRDVPESGVLNVPWPVDGFGQVTLRSATLMERSEPYHLHIELARGKLGQVRNHAGGWELMDWELPGPVRAELRQVQHSFSHALTCQQDPLRAAEAADAVLAQALWVGEHLADLCARQLLQMRRQQHGKSRTLLSCRVGSETAAVLGSAQFCEAFGGVAVQLVWSEVEPEPGQYNWEPFDELVGWCQEQNLVIKGGPLIQWSDHGLPPWLQGRECSWNELLNFVSDYVETVISRYRGRIRLWEITSRTNCGPGRGLSEDQRLRLTVRAMRAAQACDPEGVCLVTLGQPWAEYAARQEYLYSPLQFADMLIRTELGLGGLGLELLMGYEQQGSYCRDLLEVSELLDYYAMLGMPLHVTLAYPSVQGPDGRAAVACGQNCGHWHSGWNEQSQADWIEQALRLVASKAYVQEVSWSHFSDGSGHELAHAGLLRADGTAKPALERILQVRQEHML